MPKKILICDDEEGVRESLKLILGEFFDLIVVSDAAQCVEVIKNSPDIGLVLLDIKMPKASGIEVLKEIRKYNKDVTVVMVTGYRSTEAATEAVRHGATGYIMKPFVSDEIIALARKTLSGETPTGGVKVN